MFKALFGLVAFAAIFITPAHADFNSDRTTCVQPGNDFDEEIRACSRQIESGRYAGVNRAVVYRNRGIKYMNRWGNSAQAADMTAALADFARAVEIDPRYADAYVSRGKALGSKGDRDAALADFGAALQINPRLVDAYVSRGITYRGAGDNDRAIADYIEALRIDPRSLTALNNRGIARQAKGDTDGALADYSETIRIDARYAIGYNNRALVYRAKGDVTHALADLNEAVRCDPNYAQAFRNRGDLRRSQGDVTGALADFSDAIRANPRFAGAYVDRGSIYSAQHDLDRALADFSAAIRADPNNSVAYRDRGFVYERKGDGGRAIVEYSEALRLDPTDVVAWNNRGNVYRGRGMLDLAIADLDESIRRDPQFPMAFANRGLAREKAGDIDGARADFNKALALPEKFGSGTWPADQAREHLAALGAGGAVAAKPAQVAMPAAPAKPAEIAIPTVSPPAAIPPAPATIAGRRIALVIGNSAYTNVTPLSNPRHDAALVGETLKATGFAAVTVLTDLKRDALLAALRDFAAQAEQADWAVVYYAGHGMEVGGVNYLIPVDARIAVDRDIEFEAVPLGQILNAAERARKLRLVILDACRNNPFANKMKRTLEVSSRAVTQGLAAVEPEAGTMVVYAAKDGETALDGQGANSPFATALVKNLPTPGLEVRRLFDYVRDDVMDATKRKQKPFSYGSISGRQDFYFVARR